MLTKKNNTAIEINNRDMKSGRLLSHDKGGTESNKEFEGALNTAVNLIEYQFGGHSGYEYDINKRDGVVCLYYNGVLTRRYDIVQIPLF